MASNLMQAKQMLHCSKLLPGPLCEVVLWCSPHAPAFCCRPARSPADATSAGNSGVGQPLKCPPAGRLGQHLIHQLLLLRLPRFSLHLRSSAWILKPIPKHVDTLTLAWWCWQASKVTLLQLQQYEQVGQQKQSPCRCHLREAASAALFWTRALSCHGPCESHVWQAQAAALVSTRNCRRQLQCNTLGLCSHDTCAACLPQHWAPAAQSTKLPVLPGWLLQSSTIRLPATPSAACILAL